MKTMQKIFLALGVVLTFSTFSSNAQVFIDVRPAMPVHARVVAPSPRHVWVDEEWVERGGRYEWAGGHWVLPPRPGMIWIPGHWDRRPRGWVWMRGHWRR